MKGTKNMIVFLKRLFKKKHSVVVYSGEKKHRFKSFKLAFEYVRG